MWQLPQIGTHPENGKCYKVNRVSPKDMWDPNRSTSVYDFL